MSTVLGQLMVTELLVISAIELIPANFTGLACRAGGVCRRAAY